MSANTVVDIAQTCDYQASVSLGSGSNLVVGGIVDLMQANTFCNVYCAGGGGSGAIQLYIQTSDSTTSGSFVDPTSGLTAGQFPVNVASGGTFWVNSGLWNSGNYSMSSPVNNAPLFCSGGIMFGAFQRPQQYARLINVSGVFPAAFSAGFVSAKKATGSGAGFSWQPQSGTTINV